MEGSTVALLLFDVALKSSDKDPTTPGSSNVPWLLEENPIDFLCFENELST